MVSELGLCVVLFARVEHNFVVGVDLVNLLAPTSLFLASAVLWDEAARTNLTRTLT